MEHSSVHKQHAKLREELDYLLSIALGCAEQLSDQSLANWITIRRNYNALKADTKRDAAKEARR